MSMMPSVEVTAQRRSREGSRFTQSSGGLGELIVRGQKRRDVIADKEQPVMGFISAACKRGQHQSGCNSCHSLKCGHACHKRNVPNKSAWGSK